MTYLALLDAALYKISVKFRKHSFSVRPVSDCLCKIGADYCETIPAASGN